MRWLLAGYAFEAIRRAAARVSLCKMGVRGQQGWPGWPPTQTTQGRPSMPALGPALFAADMRQCSPCVNSHPDQRIGTRRRTWRAQLAGLHQTQPLGMAAF